MIVGRATVRMSWAVAGSGRLGLGLVPRLSAARCSRSVGAGRAGVARTVGWRVDTCLAVEAVVPAVVAKRVPSRADIGGYPCSAGSIGRADRLARSSVAVVFVDPAAAASEVLAGRSAQVSREAADRTWDREVRDCLAFGLLAAEVVVVVVELVAGAVAEVLVRAMSSAHR